MTANEKYIVLQKDALCNRAATKRLWDEKQQKKISHLQSTSGEEMACVQSFQATQTKYASGAQSHQIHFT